MQDLTPTPQDLTPTPTNAHREPQATYISKNFSVVTQIESGLSSFDATVWRETATGKIYVSMRGTQQLTDFLVDADLAVTGNARAQVANEINFRSAA